MSCGNTMPVPGYVPSAQIQQAILNLIETVEAEKPLLNGRTALYWHIAGILGSHTKPKE